jgi:glycosyltransferase involved in cell wall biosynthesis
MRVLHVAQPTTGGVARFVTDAACAQVGFGWDVAVAAPDSGWLSDAVRGAGANFLVWDASRDPGLGTFQECARLAAVIKHRAVDIVHLHSSKAGLVGRLRLRGRTACVFQPHAWSFDAAEGALRQLTIGWERYAARWADRVLCVSVAERQRGVAAGVTATYAVIVNSVDGRRFLVADDEQRAQVRQRLSISAASIVVCVGRLSRQKGQDLLLAAWPAVLERVPDATLVLVGSGPDEMSLRARREDHVQIVGSTDDVASWYAAADVVVIPSRWEGMPFVALEAMASGRSVVGFDVAGLREAVTPGAGAVVPSGNIPALAAALTARLLASDAAAREGRLGRQHVLAEHNPARAAAALRRLYEGVLDERPRAGGAEFDRHAR